MAKQKFTIRRNGGDGYYDWALFCNGSIVKDGMAKWEAEWARDNRRAAAENKN